MPAGKQIGAGGADDCVGGADDCVGTTKSTESECP